MAYSHALTDENYINKNKKVLSINWQSPTQETSTETGGFGPKAPRPCLSGELLRETETQVSIT